MSRESTIGHQFNPACSCPGCEFIASARTTLKNVGLPPVIGSFEPQPGDMGRDGGDAHSQIRIWTGSRWLPDYVSVPKTSAKSG